MDLLDEMRSSAVDVLKRTLIMVFHTLLTPNSFKTVGNGRPILTKDSLCSAFLVLDALYNRGHDIQKSQIRKRLQGALGLTFFFGDSRDIRSGAPKRLKELIGMLDQRLIRSPSHDLCLQSLIDSCDAVSAERDDSPCQIEKPNHQALPHAQQVTTGDPSYVAEAA